MRAVYLLLAVLLVARPAAATLVAAVSFRDGFVVASDRRTTNSDGSFVDATDKIFADGSALVVVTHRNDFSAHAFVLSDAVVSLTPAVVSKSDLPVIAIASASVLGAFFEWEKELYPSEDVSRVAFLSATWAADFLIRTKASGTPVSSTPELRDVGLDTPAYVRIYGQADYLQKVIAAHRVSPETLTILFAPPLGRDMTLDMASAFVVDIIESAERYTAVVPPRYGIGGGLDLWSVDARGPHHLLTK